jgi:hypothetical protein
MDLELHAHNMRLLFEAGYGNAACALAEQFGAGGIAERLLAALEQRSEVDTLRAQLAAANAQRDEAMQRAAKESEALFARNNDVERIAKQRDELLRAADRACTHYASKRGPCIPAMEALGRIVEAIARAQSGQPAQRDDDGTASGGGAQ